MSKTELVAMLLDRARTERDNEAEVAVDLLPLPTPEMMEMMDDMSDIQ